MIFAAMVDVPGRNEQLKRLVASAEDFTMAHGSGIEMCDAGNSMDFCGFPKHGIMVTRLAVAKSYKYHMNSLDLMSECGSLVL